MMTNSCHTNYLHVPARWWDLPTSAGDPDDMGAPVFIRDVSTVPFPAEAGASTPSSATAIRLSFDVDVAEHLFLTAAAIDEGTLAMTAHDILNPLLWWTRNDCIAPAGVSGARLLMAIFALSSCHIIPALHIASISECCG
jgi:hypothetical protein